MRSLFFASLLVACSSSPSDPAPCTPTCRDALEVRFTREGGGSLPDGPRVFRVGALATFECTIAAASTCKKTAGTADATARADRTSVVITVHDAPASAAITVEDAGGTFVARDESPNYLQSESCNKPCRSGVVSVTMPR